MRISLAILVAAATACGLGPLSGDGVGGGGDNLPTLGAGPYGRLPFDLSTPADEPFVVEDALADLSDPTALRRDDGGFVLFFARRTVGGAAEIWTAELGELTDLPEVPPRPALIAAVEWEMGEVRAPSVVAGDDGDLVLYYEAGDPPAIGRAISVDGGQTFTREPSRPIIEGARAPAAALIGDEISLFFERASAPGIFVGRSGDGIGFEIDDEPVLEPAFGADDFDRAAVAAPVAVVTETAAGRLHVGVFYEGETGIVDDGDAEVAIGYAGGFDPRRLERFATGEPILVPVTPAARGPAVVLEPDRGIMFFAQVKGARIRIAAAVHP